jgi:cytochrome b subunit of formate dehydrogenase
MRKVNIREKNGQLYFERLTLNQRIQHVVIFASFTMLALTGLPLKFHHTWWGEHLYPLVGGITWAPIVHRVSAVVQTAGFIFHFFYVMVTAWVYHLSPLRQKGTLTLKTGVLALLKLPMIPNLTDLKELMASMKYFFFLTDERPSLVAHGLKEKFGYLAVFWGIPVIGTSGFFLWGESFFSKFFTGNVLNFAYIAHSDEAFLASIVIFIWHIYNVHLTPAVFPMGYAWLNGYMGEQEIVQYHYEDYAAAMKDAGLENKMKPITQSYVYEGSFFQKAFMKIFMGVMFVSVVVSSYFISKVIYESVFVFGYQIVTTEAKHEVAPLVEPHFLEEILLEGDTEKTFYRGYRFVQEKKVKDHYHRIELDIAPDYTSHCIKCHGDLPHGKSVHIRSFLNMHNLYFACQTCHVRPKEGQERLYYYWYHRSDGTMVPDPDIGDKPIDALDIKLTPCVRCAAKPTRKDFDAERKQATELMADIQVDNISASAKKEILKQIHVNIAEEPLACAECHNKENPFLPLHEAGYPDHRIALVASDQITKMINEYKEFYTPAFLEPGVQNNHANE